MFIPNREREFDKFASISTGGAILGAAGIGAAASLFGGGGEGNKAINFTKDQIRQTRKDLNPWVVSGQNALGKYSNAIGQGSPIYGEFGGGQALPQYQNQAGPAPQYENIAGMYDPYSNQAGAVPEYSPTAGYDAFAGGDRFQWDSNALLNDPGYQFTRDEALRGTARQANAGGQQFSGNKLTALQDRAGGLASSYSDLFRQRAGAENAMNYGRDVGEYGLGVARNQDIFNRGNVGFQNALQSQGIRYGQGAQDYGFGVGRNQDIYNRGTQDFQNALQGQGAAFNQGVSDFGIDFDTNQAQYGRDLQDYGLDVSRNQDQYGRDQNVLNRLEALSGTGLNAAGQGAGLGATASNISSPGGTSVLANLNNVAQGSIANYLTHQGMQQNPYQYPGGQYAQYGGPTGGNMIGGYINPVGR